MRSVIPLICSLRSTGEDIEVEAAQFETWLEGYYFEKYLLEVCIATMERGGVTSKVDTYQFFPPIEAWGIPKYPDRTVILPYEANLLQEVALFISTNEACLRRPDCWLGTWIDPQTGNCHLDITALYPCLEDAQHEAFLLSQHAQRKIVALYDFKQAQTIYLANSYEEKEFL